MAGIKDLEQAILARLESEITGLEIGAFPDKPKNYRLRHQKGALLVAYSGANYSEPQDRWDIVQERTLAFDVHVLSRSLAGHEGAYTHLEAVRAALTGFHPTGFYKLVPEREAFVGQGGGVWTFVFTVSAGMVA